MNKLFRSSLIVIVLLAMIIWLASFDFVVAQNNIEVECGDIIPGEFTDANQTLHYAITLLTGDSVVLSIQSADDYLFSQVRLLNAKRVELGYGRLSHDPQVTSGRLSRGVYPIEVQNRATLGEFSLMIGCTKSDGTIIKPGDNPSLSSEVAAPPEAEAATAKESTDVGVQAEVQASVQPLVEIGKSYEFEYGAQLKVMKVLEVRNNNWIKVAYDEKWSWLNLSHVVLITPTEE
ncbi:MAG: hypothetical protein R3C14_49295 [Caldilineaceae bacterium]